MGFEEDLRSIAFPLLRFTAFAAHALLFGLVPILLFVLRPALRTLPDEEWGGARRRIGRRVQGMVKGALLAAGSATVLILVLQAGLVSEIRAEEVGRRSFFSVLETGFGTWHALRLPLLVGLAVLLAGNLRRAVVKGAGDGRDGTSPVWWGAWGLLGAALLATSTFSGHAMVATPRNVAVSNDIVHLIMGSTWFAGVVALAVIVPDAVRKKDRSARLLLLSPVVTRFSRVALVAITLVGITGGISSFLHLGAPEDLWTTGYGQAVASKLLLFGAILALGAINHLKVRHRLEAAVQAGEDTDAQFLFRKTIAAELVIALAVMAATAVLVGSTRTGPVEEAPPPGSAWAPEAA